MWSITVGIASTLLLGLAVTAAHAQTWKPPADSQRCPSKWGAGDERGSGNHMKPANVLRGAKLITTGEHIDLSQSSSRACRSSGRGGSTCTRSARS